MLNISNYKIHDKFDWAQFSTLQRVESKKTRRLMIRILKWTFFVLVVIALLPWTQNVRTTGTVTTISPEQRPQTVNAIIFAELLLIPDKMLAIGFEPTT